MDADGLSDLARDFDGLYFETGQGSAVTNGAAEGVDMVTLESRAYGLARALGQQHGRWMIVNDVAGFIGPEVFKSPEQLERACLEDIVMAKLHGLTMGLDVCATFHMGVAPTRLRTLTERIVSRGAPAYLMAVAGNADPMLGYLTTSFREHPHLRRRSGKQITTAMQRRLDVSAPLSVRSLYATYAKARGDSRSSDALEAEGEKTVGRLRAAGFDLGYPAHEMATVNQRVDDLYRHARYALYAALDDGVIRDAAPDHIRLRTMASDREDYLAHPARGERLAREDAAELSRLYRSQRTPQVQIVVSDGLNAHAINEHLRALLPPLKHLLAHAGVHTGATDIVITNGRVRAGYHCAERVAPEALVHFIGERPGSGLNTASAYLTYGRDGLGKMRWSAQLDHACTTAVCGIHPHGKPADVAVSEIVRLVGRMLEQRRSGVG
jgi:ethanolamine ammonia-lyase large subunit